MWFNWSYFLDYFSLKVREYGFFFFYDEIGRCELGIFGGFGFCFWES